MKSSGCVLREDGTRPLQLEIISWLERRAVYLVVVAPAVMVAIVVVIPMVVVLKAAAVAVPVAVVIPAAFVTRTDPARASVGRQRPITAMPAIVMSVRIPIAINPDVVWPRTHWYDIVARGRRRSDFNADADLGSGPVSTQQEH